MTYANGTTVADVWRALGVTDTETTSLFAVEPATGRNATSLATVAEHRTIKMDMHGLNVYFGVNPLREGVRHGRGTESDVTRGVALWADLDVKTLASLANCQRVVRRLSRELGVKPAVLIYSGHGLQPLWKVADPVTFGDNEMRTQWKTRLARWGDLVQSVAGDIHPGAKVDRVFDLSRVLRCPGSVNNKHAQPDGSGAVPVLTRINPQAEGVSTESVDAALSRINTPPSAPVTPVTDKADVHDDDVRAWIRERHGWDSPRQEMFQKLRDHSSYPYLLVRFTLRLPGQSLDASAHREMIRRVDHAVRCAEEGSPGLRAALQLIEDAYLETMRLRREGDLDGDPRSERAALDDVSRAVRGSVRAAIARTTTPKENAR